MIEQDLCGEQDTDLVQPHNNGHLSRVNSFVTKPQFCMAHKDLVKQVIKSI